jgi:hypothetical protein
MLRRLSAEALGDLRGDGVHLVVVVAELGIPVQQPLPERFSAREVVGQRITQFAK